MNYTYDSLQRLTHAETMSSAWGQTYTFDGFGNLTAKTVTKGSSTNWTAAVDPATNRMNPSLTTYDANGNPTATGTVYDAKNRVTTEYLTRNNCGAWDNYWYDPGGKRVVTQEGCIGSFDTTISFYDIFGKRIVTATCGWGNYCGSASADVYFAGKLVRTNGVTVVTDRLGSVRANSNNEHFSYLPYGEEQSPVTADNRIKFGTYVRDATGTTNQDYADQRYYNPWFGRFNTADPSTGSDPTDPGSWNKYAYVEGDPINSRDPWGLEKCEDDCPPPPWPGLQHPGPIYHGDKPPSVFPECNPNGNATIEKKLNFISANFADALGAADSIEQGVTNSKVNAIALATMFLQWSIGEGGYPGDSAQVTAENNWFGSQKGGVGAWSGLEIACPNSPAIPSNSTNACFSTNTSWGQELGAALSTVSSKTGITYGQALANALGAGAGSTAAALQAIADNGWNGSATYGAKKTSSISIQPQVNCLRKNGDIP